MGRAPVHCGFSGRARTPRTFHPSFGAHRDCFNSAKLPTFPLPNIPAAHQRMLNSCSCCGVASG